MRFWLDRGVDGFRIDVAHGMAKPDGLPDIPTSAGGVPSAGGAGLRDLRFDQDGVHDVHRLVRRVLDSYPDRMAIGEVWVTNDERLARYVRPDELHLAFNFRLLEAGWDAAELREAIDHSMRAMASVGAPTTWVLSNHDVVRHASRYGDGERGRRRARAAALVQLGLPGVAYLYYGDELALPNVELPDEVLQDPVWERRGHTERGRDGERVPMPWGGEKPPYEFTTGPAHLAADAGRLGGPHGRGAAGGPGLGAVALPAGAGAAPRASGLRRGGARVVQLAGAGAWRSGARVGCSAR